MSLWIFKIFSDCIKRKDNGIFTIKIVGICKWNLLMEQVGNREVDSQFKENVKFHFFSVLFFEEDFFTSFSSNFIFNAAISSLIFLSTILA